MDMANWASPFTTSPDIWPLDGSGDLVNLCQFFSIVFCSLTMLMTLNNFTFRNAGSHNQLDKFNANFMSISVTCGSTSLGRRKK